MSKKLLIYNIPHIHYEIIESIIYYKQKIIKEIRKFNNIKIYLKVNKKNKDFIEYMCNKYPDIEVNQNNQNINFDWIINCTIYPDMLKFLKKDEKHFYISHRVHKDLLEMPNVFYLTPLCKNNRYFLPTLLPIIEKVETDIPIYCIQGNISTGSRNYHLLTAILKKKYKYDFKIKIIGKGKYPEKLAKYSDKLIVKPDLPFRKYHQEFNDVYCIIPLIIRKTHWDYYQNKLTSTISYALGYDLHILIDKNLNDIYNMPNPYIFNDLSDISEIFEKSLINFYEKK